MTTFEESNIISNRSMEINRLRAENEQLRNWLKDRGSLDAKAEIDRLRAENAKLRKANSDLSAIAVKPDYAPARDSSDYQACGGA